MSVAPVLGLEGVSVLQGGRLLFDGVDLSIGPRDRLALIGRNGAGKTTLLRVIAGEIEADKGRRSIQPRARVVWLEQEPRLEAFVTLREYALSGGLAAYEVEAVADQLGVDLARACDTASGGERRRAAIARALAMNPDILLLDEPTNHLDIAAIEWLENWLGRYTGAFVAISHDRTFLARLTRTSLWLDQGKLRRAEVGFGGFEAWADRAREEEIRAAEKLDSKLRLELHWLERGVTGRRRRNQGRLEKLNEMRAQRSAMLGEQGVAKLSLASDDAKTKIVIDAEHVTKRFGDRTVIRDLTLKVQRGDRIGIVGPNGAGKTTLLKLLTGETQPDEGRVRQAKTLTGILVDQQRKLLDPAKRVRDVLSEGSDWIEVRGIRKHIAGYLKDYLFGPEIAEARIATLSGGERSRILLAREFARESNLLVLDEPTNDLDLETLDLLQEVIADYEGTVLLVSHDRDFLDRTVTMVLGLDGSGRIDVVAGGYSDWDARRQATVARAPSVKPVAATAAERPSFRIRLTYKEQRELDLAPERIASLERTVAAHEAKLADPSLYVRDPAGFDSATRHLDNARADLAHIEERWLQLAEKAEALAA